MSIATTVAQEVRCSVSKTSSPPRQVELALVPRMEFWSGARRIEEVDVVAELVGARLGQALDALAPAGVG